jgi:hypothetical protein
MKPVTIMKTIVLLLVLTHTALAQYTIDWHTMDAGGGSGAAGSFAMQGTLGQPDAFSGSAENVTLIGGFWSLPLDLLPALRIFIHKGNVTLAWPNPSTGFVLQASPNLLNGTWSAVALAPFIVATEKWVTWGPPIDRHFFRLRGP